ncbi:MAG: dinitrogenase iron-molybdenum cofactor biosynthesis domain-containing protein [Desulfobacteraceae bacterium 4572_89]|nr:MAG: dinitrogenase iron-molybdenum cofactor biosynthesis domain-containing protein [Desulfobacteraceae bacterium 4572_89]
MKIAITIWGNRISPVFDAAHTLLVTRIKNKTISKKNYISFDPQSHQDLIKILNKNEITTLICGAISTKPADFIVKNNIKLISFVTGNALDFIDSFASSQTIDQGHVMPGCNIGSCHCKKFKHL